MARMLRWVEIQSVCNLPIIIYHLYKTYILGIYHSCYQHIPWI
jgi:hypothetical protein